MTHQTSDGKIILIANLEDSHLKNIVNLHIIRIKQAKEILSQGATFKIQEALLNHSSSNLEAKMLKQIKVAAAALPAYIMECAIRGIDYSKELQNAFDRTKINNSLSNPFLQFIKEEEAKTPEILEYEPVESYTSSQTSRPASLKQMFDDVADKHGVYDHYEDPF
jgi:hypothetical protein